MKLIQYRINLYQVEKRGDVAVQEYKKRAFEVAQESNIEIPDNVENIDQLEQNIISQISNVLALIEEYKKAIKEYYLNNGLNIYSVRGHKYDVITRSKNILNQYEAEKGDWVFATSAEKSKNAYRIRSSEYGIFGIRDSETIIFGNGVKLQDGKLILNQPAYYYTLRGTQ